ncbi:VOC family protein [Mycobacterium sp. NPDC004974]
MIEIALYVSDVERSALFYRLIGFDFRAGKTSQLAARLPGDVWIVLHAAGRSPVTHIHLLYPVADAETVTEQLRDNGFVVRHRKLALDPDGNRIELHEAENPDPASLPTARELGFPPPPTVGELRQFLAGFPDTALVLTDGYEGGFSEVLTATRMEVQQLDRHGGDDYLGDYEEVSEALRQAERGERGVAAGAVPPPTLIGKPVTAVVLTREGR